MNDIEKEQLKMEIQHIFDSGANEIRIFEMVKSFIESRNGVNKLPIHGVSNRRELLLGFQETKYFDLYEQGVIEYKEAIEKYLAQL